LRRKTPLPFSFFIFISIVLNRFILIPLTMSSTKECRICRKEKPASEFGVDKLKRDGLRSYCKECDRKRAKANYKKIKGLSKKKTPVRKRCPGCGEVRPRSDYTKLSGRKDGLSTYCRDCRRVKMSEAYEKRDKNEPTVSHKVCPVCNEDKPTSQFYLEPKKKDGLSYDCKSCRIERTKTWAKKNPEKYRLLNKTKLRKQIKAGTRKVYNKRWLDKHPKKMRDYQKKWYKDKGLLRDQRRRMRKKALPFEFTKQDLADTWQMFNEECGFCGLKENLTLEHVVPVSREDVDNPGTVRGNLMPLCKECNSSKGTRLLDEYFDDEKNIRPEILTHIKERRLSIEDFLISIKFKLDMLARS